MAWIETARRTMPDEVCAMQVTARTMNGVLLPRFYSRWARSTVRANIIHANCGTQSNTLPRRVANGSNCRRNFCRLRRCSTISTGCAITACSINEMLVAVTRLAEGRKVEPTAAGGPRGYDAGKKIKGRKRHIVTDMRGNMLEGIVHGGDVQDRDGAPDLIERTCQTYPTVAKLFADGGYAGEKLAIEIVKRSDQAKGFVILSRRWIVERTFAWLNRCRRLAKDWETSIASSEAWIFISSIRRMTRCIAKLEF